MVFKLESAKEAARSLQKMGISGPHPEMFGIGRLGAELKGLPLSANSSGHWGAGGW